MPSSSNAVRRRGRRDVVDPATAYARAVIAGDVVAGRYVRLACARHLRDLAHGAARGLTWDAELAQHAIDFYPTFLRLAEGEHAGQPFTLHPFQQFKTGCIFGWRGPDGHRRFRRVYDEEAKGNGKTPWLAGLLLYGLAFDQEPGAQCYVAAVTREQARVMFEDAVKMAQASPALAGMLKIDLNNIAHLPSGSYIRPVSSEGRSLDAKRVHVAAIDEIHEHRTSIVVDKLAAGTKGRRQPLVVEITNSGFDRDTVCWRHHDLSVRILEEAAQNDEWFAILCGLDPCDACRALGKDQPQDDCPACDDWRDEAVWPKANPLLDVSVTSRYLRGQVGEATLMPAQADLVKRLNFCIWTDVFTRWLPVDRWGACAARVDDAELAGMPCYAGLDLGQRDDLSAFARVWLFPDGRVVVRMRYWLPESALTRFPDRPYRQWFGTGLLVQTEGNTTDYDAVESDIADACLTDGVVECAYDNRFAEQMAQRLTGRGITMVSTPQGFQLTEALRALEKLVIDGTLCHGGDPVLAWCAGNVRIRHGFNEQIRIDKDPETDAHTDKKVDGIDALAMALSRAIVAPVTGDPMITVL